MTKRTRRRFTPEYKEQAVARLSEEGVTCVSLSAELGVTSGQLKTWHLELLAAGSAEAVAQSKTEAAELAQLRRDNKRLKEGEEDQERRQWRVSPTNEVMGLPQDGRQADET